MSFIQNYFKSWWSIGVFVGGIALIILGIFALIISKITAGVIVIIGIFLIILSITIFRRIKFS